MAYEEHSDEYDIVARKGSQADFVPIQRVRLGGCKEGKLRAASPIVSFLAPAGGIPVKNEE